MKSARWWFEAWYCRPPHPQTTEDERRYLAHYRAIQLDAIEAALQAARSACLLSTTQNDIIERIREINPESLLPKDEM